MNSIIPNDKSRIEQLTALLVEVINHPADCDGDLILTLDRKSDLRARIHTALGAPIFRTQLFHGHHNIDHDTSGEPIVWRNQYHCEACDKHWEDEWTCQCDDECAQCGTALSPVDSIWIGPDEAEAREMWEAAHVVGEV